MIKICKYCKQHFDISSKPKGFMANHTRWCDHNPKKNEYKNILSKNREKISEDIILKRNQSLKKAHAEGKYDYSKRDFFKGKTHTQETKAKISEKGRLSTHRRLKRNVIEYNGIILDSTWELVLAERLDYLKIKWIRPEPLKWWDEEGKIHHYFPDFYLIDYDLYLDPKNPHAINVQQNKLTYLQKQYNNILIIDSLEQCKNFQI
jgi:hypothetical protein